MAHAWKACWVQALGGSNPPSSATGPRDRFRFRGFVACGTAGVPGAVWPDLMGRAAVCAGGRRPAREPSAPRALLGASSRSPARPRRRPPAPRPGPPAPSTPAALVVLGLARPGPAAARRHRGQALRRPPHRRHLVADVLLDASACCPAWPRHRPPAPRPGHAALAAKPRGSVVAGIRAVTALLSPGLVPLRLRGLRRSLRPGVQPGPRPSQRASIGAGPSRCSSIRPSTPSR